MLKVFYDHQIFSMQRYGGISRYYANLYESILEESHVEASLGFRISNNYYIEKYVSSFQQFLKRKLAKNIPTYDYNRKHSLKVLKKGDYDIYHPTYYDVYALNDVKKPIILTVHDMIHEIYPQYFSSADLKDSDNKYELAKRADKIIAISESTRNDLIRLFNIPEAKIEVIYHGYLPAGIPVRSSKQLILPFTNYILFVGERIRYKNFERFIEVFSELAIKYESLNLVCAGGGAFTKEEQEKFKKLKLLKKVFHISASDAELLYLYKNARLFVFPSLYEGFGLPVLEAFASNCPVALSSASSLKEVGGDAVVYFDPCDSESMMLSVLRILEDDDLADELRLKGSERLKKFTSRACTASTIQLYKSAAGLPKIKV